MGILPDLLIVYLIIAETLCGPHEKRLLNDLLDPYNTLERPVANESEPLQLSFGLMLMQIIDVDEKNQLLITNMWLKLEWNDVNLRWNHSDYGGVKDLRIPPHKIWKPDMLMYNSADEGFDGTYATNVVVNSNGSCVFIPPGIFKSTCKIDITWFPFDDQKCDMKFGSWTYDGFQLDLQLQDDNGGDISGFITNGEWDLLGVPGKRNVIYYSCCPEPYIDITFSILIRRRTLYYFFNLIVPCVLIASMAVLGFTLPPDCGEKLSLGVTILLSLTVFLNMVAETMPATSDAVPLLGVTILLSLSVFSLMIADALPQTSEAIPLLGTYFNCIMFMVASSVVSTIMILNYHHRNADTHVMSKWVKLMFLVWMPCLLCMSRPNRDDPPGNGNKSSDCKNKSAASSIHHLPDLEFRAKSSRSLLANVLDLDDDLRSSTRSYPGARSQVAPMPEHVMVEQQQQQHTMLSGGGGAASATSCLGPHRELSLILKELRMITDKLRKDEEDEEITNDWKFAAMVVDRMCLYIFTFFTVAATIAVLMSAPHVIVT
ncbi:neuronal acetylcholine receptor subunit alpha-7-like isoform X4 [Melanaphis sacchari]|uniref:neuronal acetylcholine receptor subunit alpha-7-like isoform X4 n=1 Tax=Melanaphis sacchari TaxID=742174 RepID=UPI000DC14EFB|nr:neuronal acetylcholine receptor subunit alpha-7-like isoform X4 [Melanaphis sacchari]